MCQDTRLAFESLDVRANAASDATPLDRISVRQHVVDVEIGAFQVERDSTQRVSFDVVVEVAPANKALDDNVDRILSYDMITEAIALELAAERLNLLETLAERICERILLQPLAQRVFVRIEKLDRGPGALGVEISRSNTQARDRTISDETLPHPWVIFLPNSALADANLTGWIDELIAKGDPAVLCVGPPKSAAPRSKASATKKRIDLLAIEQNAWVLAGQDVRCVVVQSRTELDWALRQGQLSVWAPSRMVLDAIDAPDSSVSDGIGLAAWFAELVDAKEAVFVGVKPPKGCNIPTRSVALGAEKLF